VTQTVPYFDTFPGLFDRFTRIWDGISTDFDNWILDALPAMSGAGVDLGCGAGRHSVLLADRVEKVLGVDVSERMLDVARAERDRPNVSYQHRGVLDVSATEGPFDVVLSVHTLHHVGPPAVVLPHVRSLVAPGGTVVIADIVDPGGWPTEEFHQERAWTDARLVHQLTGDADAAADVLRLLLHPRWLELTRSDTPLSRERFHQAYGAVFPGAVFNDYMGPVMCGLTWTAPA
jgi:SAM-dependent methyltransferase